MKRSVFLRRCLSFLLALALIAAPLPAAAAENIPTVEHLLVENLAFRVDGGEVQTVKAIHHGYGNNRYVSLRDFAFALSGTPRRFGLRVENGSVYLSPGSDYSPVGGEGVGFSENASCTTRTLAPYPILLEDRSLRYLSFLSQNGTDCYMSLTDLAMLLDLALTVSSAGMELDTAGGFTVDLRTLENEGFYYEVHSALVGDADTGTVYAAWEPELSVPIASTTKLMSFLIVMDAISDGEISLTDAVPIPEEAAFLSRTEDGAILLQAGTESNVTDLLCGMLLPSSNECALALAIYVAGSEAAFVDRMNQKARLLGLSEGAVFFNCHGLPVFTDNLAATKIQNRMSALDMFRLCAHILHVYPEITQITAQKALTLESLGCTVANSNPLVHNMPGVVGLKTGTTNMSGACLVSALEAQDAQGETHTLLAIEYGAEDSAARTTFSQELLFYGLQCLKEGIPVPSPDELPEDAEGLVRLVLQSY